MIARSDFFLLRTYTGETCMVHIAQVYRQLIGVKVRMRQNASMPLGAVAPEVATLTDHSPMSISDLRRSVDHFKSQNSDSEFLTLEVLWAAYV